MAKDIIFYKKEPNDKVWWVDNGGEVKGEMVFSFDKKKLYNLYKDYPHNLTEEEREIFDAENEFWKEYFDG